VLFDEVDEVLRGVSGEGGAVEVGVVGDVLLGGGPEIGEVAAATAGDEDLATDLIVAFEEQDFAAALGGFEGAEEAGCAGAEDDDGAYWSWIQAMSIPTTQSTPRTNRKVKRPRNTIAKATKRMSARKYAAIFSKTVKSSVSTSPNAWPTTPRTRSGTHSIPKGSQMRK
jgi:hypothetical protein